MDETTRQEPDDSSMTSDVSLTFGGMRTPCLAPIDFGQIGCASGSVKFSINTDHIKVHRVQFSSTWGTSQSFHCAIGTLFCRRRSIRIDLQYSLRCSLQYIQAGCSTWIYPGLLVTLYGPSQPHSRSPSAIPEWRKRTFDPPQRYSTTSA